MLDICIHIIIIINRFIVEEVIRIFMIKSKNCMNYCLQSIFFQHLKSIFRDFNNFYEKFGLQILIKNVPLYIDIFK